MGLYGRLCAIYWGSLVCDTTEGVALVCGACRASQRVWRIVRREVARVDGDVTVITHLNFAKASIIPTYREIVKLVSRRGILRVLMTWAGNVGPNTCFH